MSMKEALLKKLRAQFSDVTDVDIEERLDSLDQRALFIIVLLKEGANQEWSAVKGIDQLVFKHFRDDDAWPYTTIRDEKEHRDLIAA